MKRIACLFCLFFLALVPLRSQEKDAKGRGYIPLTPEKRALLNAHDRVKNGQRIAMLAKNTTIPDKFDARDKGWVPPTGDQGSCGSCYLCSTVRVFTCAYIKAEQGDLR